MPIVPLHPTYKYQKSINLSGALLRLRDGHLREAGKTRGGPGSGEWQRQGKRDTADVACGVERLRTIAISA